LISQQIVQSSNQLDKHKRVNQSFNRAVVSLSKSQ